MNVDDVLAVLSDLIGCEDGSVLDHAVILAEGLAPDGEPAYWVEVVDATTPVAPLRLIAAALLTLTSEDDL